MSTAPFILILGMHRSGTSCLAGSLEQCGLHLGNVSRKGRFNAKGNREAKDVWTLHDQILGLNRGSWHTPPDKVVVHPAYVRKIESVVRALTASDVPAGVKDPRLLLVADTWRDILGERCRLAGSFRHPAAVLESLTNRDGLSAQHGLRLWLRYNTELVRLHKERPFPLIEYDLSDYDTYCSSVASVAAAAGLAVRPHKIRQFVSRRLDHHQSHARYVSDGCRETYEYLKSHAVRSMPDEKSEPPRPRFLTNASRADNLFVIACQNPPNSEFDET